MQRAEPSEGTSRSLIGRDLGLFLLRMHDEKRGEAEAETASKRKLTGRFVKARENEERFELDDFGT